MANIQSQIKRNRQNEKLRARNRAIRTSLKTYARAFRDATDAGDKDAATAAYREAARAYDKAVSKGVVHRNMAANRKSRMSKRLAAI